MVSRFEFERIGLTVTSLLANPIVASESRRTRDYGQRAAVTPAVYLSYTNVLFNLDLIMQLLYGDSLRN